MTIYLLNLSRAFVTSGVDRYLERLAEGLTSYEHIKFIIVKVELNKYRYWKAEKISKNGLSVTIPISHSFGRYLNDELYKEAYNKSIQKLISITLKIPLPDIIHVHTINLIDLALTFRDVHPQTKIITHFHCIPWKNLISSNKKLFNHLYQLYTHINAIPKQHRAKIFTRGGSEWRAYCNSDSIICVTQSGKKFLESIGVNKNKINIIYNGDKEPPIYFKRNYHINSFNLLFVGSLTYSKGIQFLLRALALIRNNYPINLTICGYASNKRKEYLLSLFPKEMNIVFKGNVSYNELQSLYQSHDAGIITSLGEQCSFVAIEMMKYELPIITTLIDGLGEMFVHNKNCLSLPITFSEQEGLTIEPSNIAKNIIKLAKDIGIRKYLGKNARETYNKLFTMTPMIHSTVVVYEKILK